MKVKDFIDSDLYGDISYTGFNGEYFFSSYIGGINFSFELDESSEIMALYEDEFFCGCRGYRRVSRKNSY
ncbi:MAG: hypothetical protein IJA34_13115 [Lachnospiraceae bacterium]|nr:hypothetical protein [Lachnospiraceae bacterium]